jgi:hypothetical protein
MQRQALVTKYSSSPKQEKEPPRDSAPLHSIRQDINHITKERERERDKERERELIFPIGVQISSK